ncbi:glycoside hydrolase family 15 protein [Streptomyces sp. HC44]|uniref:Glycoside hydrolase family 15 protein n=1 Tax=Streptomyces scabichelini TaxID=2711217 RepID=A0A6G4VEJ8_9ACTN|nr:glycoside hydrolase family 15 protein [Streptomyces scabichelini]NGO12558.1 glycoside hydrolase family 15 protein [Streptomyces scabichelini]
MVGRIEDYALIGDLETAALVGRDGAIDWMCLPRFDSPACFAALLGGEDNGRWRIAPADHAGARFAAPQVCARRAYRGDTLILDTVWQTARGAVRVTDFMPPRQDVPRLVRLVEGLAGRVEMCGELRLRFLNGRVVPWTRTVDAHTVAAVAGPDSVFLRYDDHEASVSVSNACTRSLFTLSAGQRMSFVLDWSQSHLSPNPREDTTELLDETQEFWQQWAAKCSYQGPWREAVIRSLITLKALIYAPTGGMVAAVTSSLPECLGGERNWDYRFCWLRDSTFTLSCLLRTGYREEAVAWRNWLVRAVAGEPDDLQPLYGVSGQRRLPEKPASWLDGYEDSRPVRFGNAAADRPQLDVYGEVLNTVYCAVRAGVPIDHRMWRVVASLMDHVEQHWREPDAGLWEVRGPPRHFVHSRIMSWVAADRALRMARIAGLRGSAERWRVMRQTIHDEVCREGWDAEQRSFVQSYGSRRIDASALLLPRLGFLPPDDPRVRSTLSAVARTLGHHGFLRRYADGGPPRERAVHAVHAVHDVHNVHDVDGLGGHEGAFLACSLWLADALAATGRREEADAVFERVLDTRNDVGLLSEEWDPVAHRQLGNTPQAFSHVGLVNTAFALHGTRNGARRRQMSP